MNSIKAARQGMKLTRRSFLIGSVGGSMIMAFAPGALAAASASDSLKDKVFAPTVWFEIDTSGAVSVNVAKAEMGQHVGTALARIVADELGADWEKVSIRHVDTDPKWGYMVTGGSWSVFTSYKPLSQAGAAGRIALIEAAAGLKGVDAGDCDTENGFVVTPKGKVGFGELVRVAEFNRSFSEDELQGLPLKNPENYRLVGKSSTALDIPPKTNGTAEYGIDVEIEGMIYARPVIPPTRYGSKVVSVDDAGARNLRGYLGYEKLTDPSGTIEGWLVVLAKDYPTAIKAADTIQVKYDAGQTAGVSEDDILKEGRRQVEDPNEGALFVDEGDYSEARRSAKRLVEATYITNTAMHFALEPMNATAHFDGGIWHIHGGNQWQGLTLPTLAKALEVAEDKVVMHQYFLGGGFGRRLWGDYMIPAALTAKQTGKPVKLIFTRADDSRFDQVRSASVSRFQATYDASGQFTGMEHAFSAGWPTMAMAPPFMADSVDKKAKVDMFSASGADHWYSMPNHRAIAINNDLAQRTFLPGWLRSVGQGWIVWGLESFIDEAAQGAGVDPLEFRIRLLDGAGKQAGKAPESVGGAKRLRNTLEVLKKRIGYGKALPKDEGIGISVTAGQERTMPAWIATAAHIRLDRESGKIHVMKITMVVDGGVIVHPDGALAQLEGSAFWGVSLALHEYTRFENGEVKNVNLNTYQPLRMNEIPDLDIQFVESNEVPVGLGEPGVIGIAPAIGNAVFNAVGIRLRELPMTPERVKVALTEKVG